MLETDRLKHPISPKVLTIVRESLKNIALNRAIWRTPEERARVNIAFVSPQYRREAFKDAAYVADYQVLADINRGGLNKDEELQLFTITDRMRTIAKDPNRLTGRKPQVR